MLINDQTKFALDVAGALAGIIGIPIAIYSIIQARNAARLSAKEAEKAKDASLLAKEEVEKTRNDLKLLGNVVNFERALRLMDEIKSHIRNASFSTVPDKISSLVSLLNEIRGPQFYMLEEDQSRVQEAIVVLRKIEDAIDTTNLDSDTPRGVDAFNKKISVQIDQLHPILVGLRDKIGR